jgi:alkyl hydroperoxide reductase subunit AhpC
VSQLGELHERRAEFERAGAVLAGISADPVAETAEWQADEDEEDRISFPLLSDADLATCKAYGVHDVENEICLPAVVIVHAQDGTIRWARSSTTVGDRPSVDEVLEQVKRVGP